MNEFMTVQAQAAIMASQRQDDLVARQGVMNHQTASHLMDLKFIDQMTSMDITESFAVQGLNMSQVPREAQGINLANKTPNA